MLRSSLRGAFPAIGIDAQLEVHGTALRHRQAVAQPVVAPVPGGPDAEARHPDQTAPDRHPVAEFGLQTAARCRASVRHPRHRLPAPERLGAVLTHWIIPKLSIDSQ